MNEKKLVDLLIDDSISKGISQLGLEGCLQAIESICNYKLRAILRLEYYNRLNRR